MIMECDTDKSWKLLADQKEKEWRAILETRIESLEFSLKEKDKELHTERIKFTELKEHFKYNFKLLDERDRELEKYDATYGDVRATINSKNAEISELKIQIDDFRNVIKREEKCREELQSNYQRRLKEKQAEVDSYKSNKDGELQEERKEYEQFRRNLQLQLTNLENELGTQKKELTTEFENEIKKREHEFKVQSDELNSKVLEHELKTKLLERELELARDSSDKSCSVAKDAEQCQRELEKIIKQKEWELADVTAIKDSIIHELEDKLTSCEKITKNLQEDFQRKYTEMDRISRDREELVERTKNGYLERETVLQEEKQLLISKLEDGQIRERQLEWKIKDLINEKDIKIERLQEELQDVKGNWDRHVSEISRENVTRDLELNSAREEQRQLKLEIKQRKDDVERYKNELKASAEREDKLDKAKTQVELDWQRRCEELEKRQYDKSEDLIKKLTVARNEALALVKERDRDLQHKMYLIKSLHHEREQLRAELKKHNIPLHNFVKFSIDKEEEKEEIVYTEHLKKQNESLKQLISQMRQEMESLGGQNPNTNFNNNTKSTDSYLQDQLQNLKQENSELKEQMRLFKETLIPSAEDNEKILTEVEGNGYVKKHILALNENIGLLRSEKLNLATTVKKQQARISHLESSLQTLSTQPRQKQIEIDQLNYTLNTERKRHSDEVAGFQTQLQELSLKLAEARREADEYHRVSLERNQELVALGNQLSSLKLEMSESNPSVNYGAQELYIQQLQTELSQLRKRLTVNDDKNFDQISAKLESGGQSNIQYKLKSAASKIVQLAKENQQLIESNNRLRAQLKDIDSEKSHFPTKENTAHEVDKSNKNEDFEGRLSQLEKLQYELTRQELQYAHRVNTDRNNFRQELSGESFYSERDSTEVPEKLSKSKDTNLFPQRSQSRYSSVDPNILMSMSSGGGESIQKVWQMLDESVISTSSPPSPRYEPAHYNKLPRKSSFKKSSHTEKSTEDNPTITNQQSRSPQVGRSAALKYAENIRKNSRPKPKIRNFNITDDFNSR